MTGDHFLLLLILFLPLSAAIVVAKLGAKNAALARWISLGTALTEFLLAMILTGRYIGMERVINAKEMTTFTPEFVPGSTPEAPHATTWDIIPMSDGAVQFFIGIDGLNIWLIVLTAVLMLPSILISWTHITERVNEFYAWLLALQTTLFGVFLAFDVILFYVFFELTLIPLFFLIGIWGGPQRQYAARKFFVFTLTGSLLTLLGVLGLVLIVADATKTLTFSIPKLVDAIHNQMLLSPESGYDTGAQTWIFLALMAGFAVKVPLIPFHTWLPLAHTEAPTAGSVDLAGILLKIGAYGFLRLCIPLAPDSSLAMGLPLVTTLAVIGVIYGAVCSYAQDDVKKLIAYSSVSHMGLVMLGMFSLTSVGLSGSVFQMINHGLSTGGLFLCIGMIYERYHTRDLKDYGGMAAKMPIFAVFLVFFTLSSVGLPGLNGFIGEVLCLFGLAQYELQYRQSLVLTACAASGLVFGAWYLFTMLQRLLFGPVKEPHGHHTTDLQPREWLLLTPLAIICLVLGMHPQPILRSVEPEVKMVSRIADQARKRAGLAPHGQKTSQRNEPPAIAGDQERANRLAALTNGFRENESAPQTAAHLWGPVDACESESSRRPGRAARQRWLPTAPS